MIRKGITLIVMLLLLCISFTQSIGLSTKDDEIISNSEFNTITTEDNIITNSTEIEMSSEHHQRHILLFNDTAIYDTYASHLHSNENYNSSETIRIRNEYGSNGSSGWEQVAYVTFPIEIRLQDPKIAFAEVRFYYYDYLNWNPGGRELNIYRVTSYWNEETLTWNNQPTYDPEPISSITAPPSIGRWITWDVKSDLQEYWKEFPTDYHYGFRISDDTYWGKGNIPMTMVRSKENRSFKPYIIYGIEVSVPKQTNNLIEQFRSQNSIYNMPPIEILQINNDTTPPVTTHTLDPPEPDGENDWYVNEVEVTLNATDNESGVDRIEYRIEGCNWQTIPGDNGTFIFDDDGDGVLIEYRGVDKAGNVESTNSFTIDMDQTPPVIEGIAWEAYKEDGIWYIDLTASAFDATSGIDRVEFYINDVLQETISGGGPLYVWTFRLPCNSIQVIGFIRNLDITDEYVNFTAMLVIALGTSGRDIHIKVCAYDFAGNMDCDEYLYPSLPIEPGIYLFENLTLPNDYTGYIGRFLICASFMSGIHYKNFIIIR